MAKYSIDVMSKIRKGEEPTYNPNKQSQGLGVYTYANSQKELLDEVCNEIYFIFFMYHSKDYKLTKKDYFLIKAKIRSKLSALYNANKLYNREVSKFNIIFSDISFVVELFMNTND